MPRRSQKPDDPPRPRGWHCLFCLRPTVFYPAPLDSDRCEGCGYQGFVADDVETTPSGQADGPPA